MQVSELQPIHRKMLLDYRKAKSNGGMHGLSESMKAFYEQLEAIEAAESELKVVRDLADKVEEKREELRRERRRLANGVVKMEVEMGEVEKLRQKAVGIVAEPMLRDFLRAATQITGMAGRTITSQSREKQIVRVRQAAMWAARKGTYKSYPEIGVMFGKKDHSTIMHAVSKVEADEDLKELGRAILARARSLSMMENENV